MTTTLALPRRRALTAPILPTHALFYIGFAFALILAGAISLYFLFAAVVFAVAGLVGFIGSTVRERRGRP